MNVRATLAMIVGVVEITMAVLAVIIASISYLNFLGVQTGSDIPVESNYLHVLALSVFGLFSIASGLFLVHEWVETR